MLSAIRKPARLWAGLVAAPLLVCPPSVSALESDNYGYIRTIEGYADLIESQTDSIVKLTANHPVGVGDQLRIAERGRVEAVLPDGSHLRLGESTELELNRLAQSADSQADTTLILLHQGEAQLVSLRSPYDPEAFRIDTANSTIYIQQRGTYRIFTDGESWTDVSVREGQVLLVTESGSSLAQAGETIFVQGARDPRVRVEQAGQLSALERWGEDLTESSHTYASQYVDPSLAYASTPLTRHGSWMRMESKYVWRPNVSPGWRPYHSGWWTRTPRGLTWVSTEPWGWLTYHYGAWNFGPSTGWVWHPGTTYTPAAVYWYWGPSHVGWIPSGYYNSNYGQHYPRFDDRCRQSSDSGSGSRSWAGSDSFASVDGLGIGVHGVAGGSVANFNDWTFTRHRYLGRRGAHTYLRTGEQLANQGIFEKTVPPGIIATDTRALTPDLWQQPSRAMEVIRGSQATTLADVTSWVARRPEPSEQVSSSITIGPRDQRSHLKPGVVVHDVPEPGLPSRRSVAETWRLEGNNEAPSRIWGSDLRQRRQERRPVARSSGSFTMLPMWEDMRAIRQNSRQSLSSRSSSSSLSRRQPTSPTKPRSSTSRHQRPSRAKPGQHLGRSTSRSSRSSSMGRSSGSSRSSGMSSGGSSRSSSSGTGSRSNRPSRPGNGSQSP